MEADQDRCLALALFSTARTFEKQKRLADAVRHYQRAFRYDPSAKLALSSIVRLTKTVDWNDERLRYLTRLANLAPSEIDAAEIVDLVEALSPEKAAPEQSISLLQKLLDSRRDGSRSPVDLILHWRLAEWYHHTGKDSKAASAAEMVLAGLESPESFGMTQKMVDAFLAGSFDPFSVFGNYCLAAGDTRRAEALFAESDRRRPHPGRLALRRARVAFYRNDHEQALEILENGLSDLPKKERPIACETLGKTLAALGREGELTERLDRWIQTWPDEASLWFFLGESHLEAKRYQAARDTLEKADRLAPTAATKAALARLARETDRPETWIGLLAKTLERTGSLGSWAEEMRTTLDDPVWSERILKTAQKSFANNPEQFGPMGPLAMARFTLEGDHFEVYRALLPWVEKTRPDQYVQLELIRGRHLLESDRSQEAIDVLLAARDRIDGASRVDDGSEKAILCYYLSSALARVGKTDRAIETIRPLLERPRPAARLVLHRAWIEYHAKRYEAAAERYEAFLRRFDDRMVTPLLAGREEEPVLPPRQAEPSIRSLIREARKTLAHVETLRGNLSRAESLLETVLDEYPDDIGAMNDLGYLWIDQKRHPKRALAMIRKAVEEDPENGAYLDSLGWALFRHGKTDESIRTLKRACRLTDPPEEEIFEHLSAVYRAIGQNERADRCADRAREASRKRIEKPQAADESNPSLFPAKGLE